MIGHVHRHSGFKVGNNVKILDTFMEINRNLSRNGFLKKGLDLCFTDLWSWIVKMVFIDLLLNILRAGLNSQIHYAWGL